MLDRLRQSLAFRLAVQYAVVFAAASAIIFAVLFWALGRALTQRDQATLERRAADLALTYVNGGLPALRLRLDNDPAADLRGYFVRVIGPGGEQAFVKVPPDWIETQVEQLPMPGFTVTRQTVRVPQNAERDYTLAAYPLPEGWAIQVGGITDSRAVLLRPLQPTFVVVGGGALLLSVALGTVLAWRATRPLRLVSATARRILETGDLGARVPAPGGTDELAVLVHQLNTLLDTNAAHVRVLRETLDNLAHDLRTPLTRLRGTAELALGDTVNRADADAALADCIDESDRVLHLLEALLDIAAAEAGALKLNREPLDVRSLTERAVDLYREVAEAKNITMTLDQPVEVALAADAIRLGQAINNLVDNALKYTSAGGRVVIAARNEPGAAIVTVSDNGPGVPVAERDAVFRRLYRGDSSRSQRGLGLGLSLVKAIVESHGGTVAVDDAPGGGGRFTLRLPAMP
ncbi:MAG TPA: HAMP domain-containing sensor histidine kinase [Candidatus Didemnitutus sp.]|nr:HAMP domain-containing sensor histidine kinase [Candidatus Didemnitutus sp.]